jgi:error-prone DNA polymerase
VIQYVYERHGRLGAAMTANVITYRSRSAAREVGKVLEMAPDVVDRMARAMSPFEWQDPQETLARHLADAGLDAADPGVRFFADLWRRIQDLPRHIGQHSGGMVVCQRRLDEVVPLEPATMPGRVVIQWDKEDCADMGIVKVDLLGLGMMAVLQDALTIVNRRVAEGTPDGRERREDRPARGSDGPAGGPLPEDSAGGLPRRSPAAGDARPDVGTGLLPGAGSRAPGSVSCLDLAHLPPDDPLVYRMLQEADTIGVFQVESRAQMATLPRLKPRNFYDLVVEVAIIRPGPIVGQMVHPFIERRNGRETIVYPHPSLEPILKRTLGVPLFQEQLLRMAMVAAGFTGGEAEELRRAMGFKRSEARMRQIETKLRDGMARNGIAGDAAEAIVGSITSFALYGFPESHAASFALLVYASAYLKAHFPAAFYTALLNNQPMGFYHPATIVKDAQRHGVRFRPIDVQASSWDCTIEPDGVIRLGLRYVRGLREEAGRRIEQAGGSDGRGARTKVEERAVEAAGPRQATLAGTCPKCGTDDETMLERDENGGPSDRWFCNVCAHDWAGTSPAGSRASRGSGVSGGACPPHGADSDRPRFRSIDHLVAATGLRRDELATLGEIGALSAFGSDRRGALWQIERAVRPAGVLFEEGAGGDPGVPESGAVSLASPGGGQHGGKASAGARAAGGGAAPNVERRAPAPGDSGAGGRRSREPRLPAVDPAGSPLPAMTPVERVIADYEGTGLTIGPHPLALRRAELALRGILRAIDLPRARAGRRVRVAGAVITRQRPGTAKGFVFLTLEDETGIANVIVQPDVFTSQRQVIVHEPFVIVGGILQQQDGVTSVRAERVVPLSGRAPDVESHDFR